MKRAKSVFKIEEKKEFLEGKVIPMDPSELIRILEMLINADLRQIDKIANKNGYLSPFYGDDKFLGFGKTFVYLRENEVTVVREASWKNYNDNTKYVSEIFLIWDGRRITVQF